MPSATASAVPHIRTACLVQRSQILLRIYTLQSAMKQLARGKAAAPPPPLFWAPYQQRACNDGEDLILHMEPLPDDLEPEE